MSSKRSVFQPFLGIGCYIRMCMHTCFSSFHVFQSSMVEDMPYVHIHTYIHTSLPQRSNELETKSSIDFGMYSHTYLKLCVCVLLTCKSCVSLTFLVWGAQMHIVLGNLETQVVSPGFWGIVRKRTWSCVCVFMYFWLTTAASVWVLQNVGCVHISLRILETQVVSAGLCTVVATRCETKKIQDAQGRSGGVGSHT